VLDRFTAALPFEIARNFMEWWIFLIKIKFFHIFLNGFDILILKIIFKNKKYYFNIFPNKK
jgi:hypothetical protein